MENSSSTPLLSWEAHIHPKHTRGTSWYITAVIIITMLLAYSISIKAWSFTVVLAMFSILYWFIHRKPDIKRSIKLYDWGFSFDEKHVEWEVCTGYWFLVGPGYHELHIEHNKKVIGEFVIQTGEKQIIEIHKVLNMHLEELDNKDEKKLDTFARILKI